MNGSILVCYSRVKVFNNNVGAGYLNQPTNIFVIKRIKDPAVVPTSPQVASDIIVETK
ncbi:hypothetical protein [Hahella sp. HN01]|uniref:hypothetical protein n=1 Tax=Hahella sp. HN01 TaxID=2847262 RepID=UPI001C1EDF81|nr:hypothetical protein [Hahella sp. HN01]MBU6955978.1 hypothetical protein [Hahella sp. HN01]